MERYKILFEGGEGELTEKKSRFIATTRPVKSEEEAVAFIDEMKKKYWDARHNCSAYVIGERGQVQRCRMTASRLRPQAARCWMCFWARK